MAPPRVRHSLLDDPVLLADAYSVMSIADVARQADVSASTVQRALVRHGIDRKHRNWSRRPLSAELLDDEAWLAEQYRVRTGVEIADSLGVSTTMVYAAMARHNIPRRATSSTLPLREPKLADSSWLRLAVEGRSSGEVAEELQVSPGTVTAAYRQAGIDPSVTSRFYARGRSRERPPGNVLREAWEQEGTYRGVGRRIGVAHSTAAVWLAEADVYADPAPVLSRSVLKLAISEGWPLSRIAAEHAVSVTTVRVELHRHRLFDIHRTRHRW